MSSDSNDDHRGLRQELKQAGYSDAKIDELLAYWFPADPVKGRRRRRAKWTQELNRQLIMDVLKLCGGTQPYRSGTRGKVAAACRTLIKRQPYKTLAPSARALSDRFHRLFIAAVDIYVEDDKDPDDPETEWFMKTRPPAKKCGRS